MIKNNLALSNNQLTETNRNMIILPQHVGKTVHIHNGKEYVKLILLKEMIYHKLGEFIKTRNIHMTKKRKELKNKTKKRKTKR